MGPKSFLKNNLLVNVTILILIWVFLLTFFKPGLLFLKTTASGGDTASHYYTAQYLKEYLLPHGKIMGWLPANYAGFPIFYHYFPLPFLLMALLGYVIPLEISFKLITVVGTFLLPVCVYLMFRVMRFNYPVPILGAIFSLAFLCNEKNSMWGGNIPSTLAGEFSFSLSLAIFIVFLAVFYLGIEENKHVIINAVLFFLMGFSHGYTLLFFVFLSTFYLFSRNILKNLWYMFRVYALGGMLLSFWLLPFMANLPYVIPFHITWFFGSWQEVVPPALIPFFVFSGLSILLNLKDRRYRFLGYALLLSVVLYFIGPKIGLVDIRFLTFMQLFLTIFGAAFIDRFSPRLRLLNLVPIIFVLFCFIWVNENTTFIKSWIEWNYSGFERKTTWSQVSPMLEYLKKTNDGGRVVYENSVDYNVFGTQRIFESLRMFSGRDTLEGLYMQSSISAPFVFYIQSEISNNVSAPFWDYKVSAFNLKNGARHLRGFNVTQMIVRSDKVKNAIKNMPEFKLERNFGICDVYRVAEADGHCVTPAKNEPVMYTKKNWKKDFYEWFKIPEIQDVPVVYTGKTDEKSFKLKTDNAVRLKKTPIRLPQYNISEKMENESIEFETSLIGYPHIIRISYHPNWRVEGAEKIFMVSPSFMLVYPKQNKVRLTFGKNRFNYIGEFISATALIGIFAFFIVRRKPV